MSNWMIYVSITVVCILFFVSFSIFKKKYIKEMSKTLYADNNPDLYLKRLDNIEGKIFVNKKMRLFRKIDAYAMKNDKDNILNIFKELESLKLSFGQKVNLYEKEVEYYINQKIYDKAIEANKNLQDLAKQLDVEDLQKIAINCNALVETYANKNGSLANEMVKYAEKANIVTVKGTYYFRAARCYYYRNEPKLVDKYLEKAYDNLAKTSLASTILACKNNHEKIEDINI